LGVLFLGHHIAQYFLYIRSAHNSIIKDYIVLKEAQLAECSPIVRYLGN